MGFPSGKNLPANVSNTGDAGSISGWGKSPGGANGKPLLYVLAWEIPRTEEPRIAKSDTIQYLRSSSSSGI